MSETTNYKKLEQKNSIISTNLAVSRSVIDSNKHYWIIPYGGTINGYRGYAYYDISSNQIQKLSTHIPLNTGFLAMCMKIVDGHLYTIQMYGRTLEIYTVQTGKPVSGKSGMTISDKNGYLISEMVQIANSLWLMNTKGKLYRVDCQQVRLSNTYDLTSSHIIDYQSGNPNMPEQDGIYKMPQMTTNGQALFYLEYTSDKGTVVKSVNPKTGSLNWTTPLSLTNDPNTNALSRYTLIATKAEAYEEMINRAIDLPVDTPDYLIVKYLNGVKIVNAKTGKLSDLGFDPRPQIPFPKWKLPYNYMRFCKSVYLPKTDQLILTLFSTSMVCLNMNSKNSVPKPTLAWRYNPWVPLQEFFEECFLSAEYLAYEARCNEFYEKWDSVLLPKLFAHQAAPKGISSKDLLIWHSKRIDNNELLSWEDFCAELEVLKVNEHATGLSYEDFIEEHILPPYTGYPLTKEDCLSIFKVFYAHFTLNTLVALMPIYQKIAGLLKQNQNDLLFESKTYTLDKIMQIVLFAFDENKYLDLDGTVNFSRQHVDQDYVVKCPHWLYAGLVQNGLSLGIAPSEDPLPISVYSYRNLDSVVQVDPTGTMLYLSIYSFSIMIYTDKSDKLFISTVNLADGKTQYYHAPQFVNGPNIGDRRTNPPRLYFIKDQIYYSKPGGEHIQELNFVD